MATEQIDTTDAFTAIELFQERGWTDGLPVVPPTEDRVEDFLAVAGLPPDTVLLEIPMTHREVTVRLAAINAVMAGCLPEHLPVILAAIKGWADPRWGSGDPELFYISSTSTGGGAQMLIVNGPVAEELGINGKVNVFGPGNRANSAIGRAVRLILINAGGFIPGVVDNAGQGHPGKFSFCIAENEDESPWEPLHVERGFDSATSTVTTISCRGPEPIENRVTQSPEGILLTIADTLSRLGAMTNAVLFPTKVVAMGPEHANIVADAGWSKKEVKQFLHENCRRSVADLHRIGMTEWPDDRIVSENGTDYLLGCSGPEDILLIVAGGYNAGISSVLTNWAYGIPYGDYITIPIDTDGGPR